MGDNRDDSIDSDFSPVDRDAIIGRSSRVLGQWIRMDSFVRDGEDYFVRCNSESCLW